MPQDNTQDLVNQAFDRGYGKSILVPGRMVTRRKPNFFQRGAEYVRDVQLWELPILPGAVFIFQQLAATREWQITGKVRSVSRAVDFMNDAKIVSHSGYIYTGFEEFLRRRALDYLACGRTAFAVNSRVSKPVLEYLDPTRLYFERDSLTDKPVTDNEKIWRYNNFEERYFRNSDVYLTTPIPLGATDNFVSPISFILPNAMLAWLLREHDTAALDGRKIREILFVGSDSMAESIEGAVKKLVAIHSGADPSKVGIPVVTVQNVAGIPIANQIARIGLSSIPENFDREKFIFSYANQIAAALGLPLRQFWNEETTTNRSLEEVQERRGQRKGPTAFVRSEERLINTSKILSRFGKVHFSFVEEVDSSSQKTNAEVLNLTADALKKFSEVFGVALDLHAVEAWMQMIRVLPANLQIMQEGVSPQLQDPNAEEQPKPNEESDEDENVIERPDDSPIPSGKDETVASIDEPELSRKKAIPDYGEVSVNQDGVIVERRRKTFSVVKFLVDEDLQNPILKEEPKMEELFEQSVHQSEKENLKTVLKTFEENSQSIFDIVEGQNYFNISDFSSLLDIVQNTENPSLNDHQQFILNYIVGEL